MNRNIRKQINLVKKLDEALEREFEVFLMERPFLRGGDTVILNYEKERIEAEREFSEIISELKAVAWTVGIEILSEANERKNGF